jgi:p-cumate 2,3-dioxygenase ferredoxin reductase subunit
MSDQPEHIVIVGAGQAGTTVALAVRRLGFEGQVTLVGEETHLPYERPQLSKDMLLDPTREIRSIKPAAEFEDKAIVLRLGQRVATVDDDRSVVVLEDGIALTYDRLVIATGARARRLDDCFPASAPVLPLRTVEDAIALRGQLKANASLVILGGGVIGLEVAAAACRRDCKVTVLEAGAQLMARSVDATIGRFLHEFHTAAGVDIRYGATVSACDHTGRLSLSDGTQLDADCVLLGVGVEPNVAAFESLGITDTHGVCVDAYGRTARPRIYATGDVASQRYAGTQTRIETWANAQNHALAVAANVLGGAVRYDDAPWFWSDQGALNLQVVGNARAGRAVLRGEHASEAFSVFHLDDAHHLIGAVTVNVPRDMAMARRWVAQGAHLDPHKLSDPSIPLRDCVI